MQSPDFIFYLFVLMAAIFGVLAVYARRKVLDERAAREELHAATEPASEEATPDPNRDTGSGLFP